MRHADLRVRRAQVGLRDAHVGPLAHEIGRQAERAARRGRRNDPSWNVAATASLGKRPVRMASRSRCWSSCFSSGGSSSRACATAVSCATTSGSAIWPRSFCRRRMSSSWVCMLDQPARRRDLSAQRRLLDGGERDVGRQREIDAFALEGLGLGLRLGDFDLPARPAPHVGHVGDADLRGVQAVDARARWRHRWSSVCGRHLLAGRIRSSPSTVRKQRPALRQRIGLGDPHRGLGGLQVRIVGDALLDQVVQMRASGTAPTSCAGTSAPLTTRTPRPRSPPRRKLFTGGRSGGRKSGPTAQAVSMAAPSIGTTRASARNGRDNRTPRPAPPPACRLRKDRSCPYNRTPSPEPGWASRFSPPAFVIDHPRKGPSTEASRVPATPARLRQKLIVPQTPSRGPASASAIFRPSPAIHWRYSAQPARRSGGGRGRAGPSFRSRSDAGCRAAPSRR